MQGLPCSTSIVRRSRRDGRHGDRDVDDDEVFLVQTLTNETDEMPLYIIDLDAIQMCCTRDGKITWENLWTSG